MNSAKYYLKRALELAQPRRGFCSPNPAVGAVLVKGDTLIGEGSHFAAGHPHAEINALCAAGAQAKNAVLYVTLEPCSHTGRTPPCVDAIIAAQVKKVIYAYQDPNPLTAGKCTASLHQANIECEQQPCKEITEFYHSYQHWMSTQTPWVTAKIALSKDHKIALPGGRPAQITGPKTQQFTHAQRLKSDAILTSIQTILQDDPQLNIRLPNKNIAKPIYVLDSHGRLPKTARIHQSAQRITVFQATNTPPHAHQHTVSLPQTKDGLDLSAALRILGQEGLHDVWVEAGGRVFTAFVQQGLADELYVYQSPITLGTQAPSLTLTLDEISNKYRLLSENRLDNDLIYHFIRCA